MMKHAVLVVASMFLFGLSASADRTNFYWTGGGDSTRWTDANNWTNTEAWWLTSPRYPGTTNDIVWLGAAEAYVPDVPQNIQVDATGIYVWEVEFLAQGNREITLTGEKLQMWGDWNYVIPSTATADVNIDLELEWPDVGGPYLRINSTNMVFRIGPDGALISGANRFRLQGANARIRNEGRIVASSEVQMQSEGLTLTLAPLSNNVASARRISMDSDDTVLEIEKDAQISEYLTLGTSDKHIIRTGPGDVSFRIGYRVNPPWLRMRHGYEDDGNFTVELSYQLGSIETVTNSTVLFYGPGGHPSAYQIEAKPVGDTNEVAISGPGNMEIAMESVSRVFSIKRPVAHTGGLLVRKGILQLGSEAGVSSGQLPDTGLVSVLSDGTLDLNGIDDTIGGLGGVGDVLLGGATLTIAEGVAPGLSVGTQTISEAGTVILGGTSTFEIDATSSHDQMLLPTANLTLGGTLNVVINGPFKEEYYTSYKIFDLTDGAASGMFSKIEGNFDGYASVEIDANHDVILTLNRPRGMVITVR